MEATDRNQSRPEVVVLFLIIGKEPDVCDLPVGIDPIGLSQDGINGFAIPFTGGMKEGHDVVVTGEQALQLGMRATSLPRPGQRIHRGVSSPVGAAEGIVAGKMQDDVFSVCIPEVVHTPRVPRLKGPAYSHGIRVLTHDFSGHCAHLYTTFPPAWPPLRPKGVHRILIIGQGPVLAELPIRIDPIGLSQHHVQVSVVPVRRDMCEDTAMTVVGQDILTGDQYQVAFFRASGERHGNTMDVTYVMAIKVSPDGKFEELWFLGDDQAAYVRFWS
jgi:hypothetical protein